MAGRGPAPKDPSKRARRNADVIPLRVLEVVAAEKPELPESFVREVKVDKATVPMEFEWPAATVLWWRMLDAHPLKREFTDLDWSYLLDTARLHAEYWLGVTGVAAELRLREAKYGFTPEDRARLRIQFAQATEAEVQTAERVQSARDRFGGMKVSQDRPADALEA